MLHSRPERRNARNEQKFIATRHAPDALERQIEQNTRPIQIAHELRNHGAGRSQPGHLQMAVFQAEVEKLDPNR